MSDLGLPESFEIRRTSDRETLTLTLCGELDLASAPILDDALRDAASTGLHHTVVDLTELDFIDSSGVHSLVRAQAAAERDRRRFSLRPGSKAVQRLFEITGLIGFFTFED